MVRLLNAARWGASWSVVVVLLLGQVSATRRTLLRIEHAQTPFTGNRVTAMEFGRRVTAVKEAPANDIEMAFRELAESDAFSSFSVPSMSMSMPRAFSLDNDLSPTLPPSLSTIQINSVAPKLLVIGASEAAMASPTSSAGVAASIGARDEPMVPSQGSYTKGASIAVVGAFLALIVGAVVYRRRRASRSSYGFLVEGTSSPASTVAFFD